MDIYVGDECNKKTPKANNQPAGNMTVKDWITTWFFPPSHWLLDKNVWTSHYICITWEIWKLRCRRVFAKSDIDAIHTASLVDNLLIKILKSKSAREKEIFKAAEKSQGTIWIPPFSMNLKLNVDITFTSADNRIGIGYILRDHKGSFLRAGLESGTEGTSEEAECRGIVAAVLWAIKANVKRLELETDCRGAADFLNGHQSNLSWVSLSILAEISGFISAFDLFTISFCNRPGNNAAHIMANSANVNQASPSSLLFVPLWLVKQLKLDQVLCNMDAL